MKHITAIKTKLISTKLNGMQIFTCAHTCTRTCIEPSYVNNTRKNKFNCESLSVMRLSVIQVIQAVQVTRCPLKSFIRHNTHGNSYTYIYVRTHFNAVISFPQRSQVRSSPTQHQLGERVLSEWANMAYTLHLQIVRSHHAAVAVFSVKV